MPRIGKNGTAPATTRKRSTMRPTGLKDLPSKRLVVFFAEDDDDNAEVVSGFLELLGHKALRSSNGQELLTQIEAQLPDVVLLDLDMPVLDGFATLAILRQDTRFAEIPIAAMSGCPEKGLAAKLKAAGFAGFLPKPFSKSMLKRFLDHVDGEKQS